jgi:hypothetical protein
MAVNSAMAYGAVQFHKAALFDYRKVFVYGYEIFRCTYGMA